MICPQNDNDSGVTKSGMEHGVTFADDTEGAFALNPPVAGQIKDAALRGYQLLLRSVMSYSAASRALGPGERAFEDATKFLVAFCHVL